MRSSNPSLLLSSMLGSPKKKRKKGGKHTKSEASLNLDKAILQRRARKSYIEGEKEEQQQKQQRSPVKLRSPSPIRGRRDQQQKNSPKKKMVGNLNKRKE